MEIEFRSDLNDKIIEVVTNKGLTHSDVARLAHTSRTRVTAILNRNTHDISTDLMLRVLASLGVKAKLQFKSAAKVYRSVHDHAIAHLQNPANYGHPTR